MKNSYPKSLFIAVTLLTSLAFPAQKKVLVISDIDDTLKVSHVLNPIYAAARMPNYTVRFSGMAQLFQLLAQQPDTSTEFAYISNALKSVAGVPLLEMTHEQFLAHNHFPAGILTLRENLFDHDHKIREIRQQLNQVRPDAVIFFGDNGQRDSEIYQQAVTEYKNTGIHFTTFIHQVYKTKRGLFDGPLFPEIGNKILMGQVAYITPVEIALELNQQDLFDKKSTHWMIRNVGTNVVQEKFYNSDAIDNITFPSFQDCSEFVWVWPVTTELIPLVKKINSTCHKIF